MADSLAPWPLLSSPTQFPLAHEFAITEKINALGTIKK